MTMKHLRNTGVRRALVAAATVLAGVLDPLPSPSAALHADRSEGCGFRHVNPDHHGGATALYIHCANSFILIRVDTRTGSHHQCVGPWGSVRFYPAVQVVNAYYVTIPPRLLTTADGSLICSLTQPPV